jgi:26S proteasome regulatory subunit N9
MSTVPAFLETQKAAHPELAELYEKLQTSASNKLWHQTTIALEELFKAPCFSAPGNKDLLELFKSFLQDQPQASGWTGFASKISPVKHALLAITASKQYDESEAGISSCIEFLEEVDKKLGDEKEAVLLTRLEIARRKLQKGDVAACKTLTEECQNMLNDLAEVDNIINSSFYLVSSLLHKNLGSAEEFYKNSLLYLAYTPLDSLSDAQKQALAFDLGLAALCGEKIFQFGELLLHPILASLEGTQGAWLVEMLGAFNTGDIGKFEQVSKTHEAAIKGQAALTNNQQNLREKIRIFALMELLRDIPADSRTVSFKRIAERTALPEEEVELLLMKSLSLSLVKGTISGVDSTVRVTWVQPRVMDLESLGRQKTKLTDWMDKVQRTSVFLSSETPEILA